MDRPHPIRLLLVDSHALTRSAIGCLLSCLHGIAVVGEAGTLVDGLTAAAESAPDVVLLHLRQESGLGVEAITALLLAAGPGARLLVVTDIVDAALRQRAVRLGAYGIVGTDQPAEASGFLDWLIAPEGRAALGAFGFLPAPTAATEAPPAP